MSTLFAIMLALMSACPTEDSTMCGWDAARQGDGYGRSFIAFSEAVIWYE